MNVSLSKSYREINGNDRNKIVDYYYKHKDISIDNIEINLNLSDILEKLKKVDLKIQRVDFH